jgi:hypothetical protein
VRAPTIIVEFIDVSAEIATIAPMSWPPMLPNAPSITSTPTAFVDRSPSNPRPYQIAATNATYTAVMIPIDSTSVRNIARGPPRTSAEM